MGRLLYLLLRTEVGSTSAKKMAGIINNLEISGCEIANVGRTTRVTDPDMPEWVRQLYLPSDWSSERKEKIIRIWMEPVDSEEEIEVLKKKVSENREVNNKKSITPAS